MNTVIHRLRFKMDSTTITRRPIIYRHRSLFRLFRLQPYIPLPHLTLVRMLHHLLLYLRMPHLRIWPCRPNRGSSGQLLQLQKHRLRRRNEPRRKKRIFHQTHLLKSSKRLNGGPMKSGRHFTRTFLVLIMTIPMRPSERTLSLSIKK